MYLGKPAIATRHSGNLDFMTDENSLLVDCELVDVETPPDLFTLAKRWAEPDIEHAAKLMRSVFDDRELARTIGWRASADVRSSHSPLRAGEVIAERSHSPLRAGEVIAERLEPLLADWLARAGTNESALRLRSRAVTLPDDPAHAASAGGRSLRALARNAALRAMKPYAASQDALNEAVRDTLLQLQPELMRLDRRQAAIEARLAQAGVDLSPVDGLETAVDPQQGSPGAS